MGTGNDMMAKMRNDEWAETLRFGLEHHEIELEDGSAALGITKQVIYEGHDSLTDKQKSVFKEYVLSQIPRHCPVGHRVSGPHDVISYWVSGCGKCNQNLPE